MTNQIEPSSEDILVSVGTLRHRVRNDRHNFWFPLVVFGLITLISVPLYYGWPLQMTDQHCHYYSNGTATCSGTTISHNGVLTSGFSANQLGGWLSFFWIATLILGYLITMAFYRHRSMTVGLKVRIWPAAVVGLGVLLLTVLMKTSWHAIEPSFLNAGDLWTRGTVTFIILSIGIVTLAILERSVWYVMYALGFVGVALLSSLYNVSNLLQWDGLGRFITPSNEAIPNVVLSSLYLLIGGFVFWAIQHDARVANNGARDVVE